MTKRGDHDRAGCGDAPAPEPPSEYGQWLLALALVTLGVGVLVAVLTGAVDGTNGPPAMAAPPVVATATPTPGAAAAKGVLVAMRKERTPVRDTIHPRFSRRARRSHDRPRALVLARLARVQRQAATPVLEPTETTIPTRWVEGFYPIYAVAQRTFGVNWLPIASIHRHESAFSTDPTTYQGLNFAGCCGGAMQFSVTNGPVTTWDLMSDSYRYGRRPAVYDHMTAKHPSIYDDFDAVMAAAHLLSEDGATDALNAAAWRRRMTTTGTTRPE
ncbi:MAG TPA: hypothetical protein VK701_07575 [Solirubrobacteraceae bacterium]|jgi:hypothetical protein|nr:hypothetical protein [Solirubrobacteraceae bacterium]